MKKELLAKELVRIAKELVAEQYSVSDITKKDWDRAWDLLHKPISAATSMRKLTKQPKKLFARAACIYAIYNKIDQAEKIRDEYDKLFAKIRKRINEIPYDLYNWKLTIYADELLKDMPYLIKKVEKIKLQDIPYGKSMCKQFDDFIKQTQEDIKNFSKYEEEYKNKWVQNFKNLKQFEKEVLKKSRSFYLNYYKNGGYWTKGNIHGDRKPRQFDIYSIPENVIWYGLNSTHPRFGKRSLREFLFEPFPKYEITVYKVPEKLYDQFVKLYNKVYR